MTTIKSHNQCHLRLHQIDGDIDRISINDRDDEPSFPGRVFRHTVHDIGWQSGLKCKRDRRRITNGSCKGDRGSECDGWRIRQCRSKGLFATQACLIDRQRN